MSHFRQRLLAIALLLAAACLTATVGRAESPKAKKPPMLTVLKAPPAAKGPTAETPEDKIYRLLQARVRARMADMPLSQFARQLGRELGVRVALHHRELDEFNIDGSFRLTFSAENVQVRTMLKQMLNEHGMMWAIRDGALLITSEEYVANIQILRIYDVADLVTVWRDGAYDFDFGPIIGVLTSAVRCDTWMKYGGKGLIEEHEADYLQILVVANTREVHEEIERLLAELRRYLPAEPTGLLQPREQRDKIVAATERGGFAPRPRNGPIKRAMAKRMSFHFKEMPLGKFVALLGKRLGVGVRLDRELKEMDIDANTRFSADVSNVTAGEALQEILSEQELSWIVEDDAIVITCSEYGPPRRFSRIYDVSDLVAGNTGLLPPARPTPTKPQPSKDKTDDLLQSYPQQPFSAWQSTPVGVESLIKMVTTAVFYDTWRQYGGEGLCEPFKMRGAQLLHINHSLRVHKEVEEFLSRLREIRRMGNGRPMPRKRFIPRRDWLSEGDPELGGFEGNADNGYGKEDDEPADGQPREATENALPATKAPKQNP